MLISVMIIIVMIIDKLRLYVDLDSDDSEHDISEDYSSNNTDISDDYISDDY